MGRMNIDPMDARFMTEREIAKELGVTMAEFKAVLSVLIERGFPPPDARFFNRRYWPRVKMFLDHRYGLADDEVARVNRSISGTPGPDGKIW